MASFNRVILMGNLTRDVSVKTLPSNTTVAEFGIATNRRYKTAAGEEKEEVCFVDCTAFGRPAEVIAQYCAKGKPLMVEGRLKWDSWQDRDGTTRSKLSVVVEQFQFLGQRNADEGEPRDENDQRAMVAGVFERQQAAKAETRKWRGRSSGPVDHRGPLEGDAGPVFRPPAGKPQQASVTRPFGDESHFKPDDLPF